MGFFISLMIIFIIQRALLLVLEFFGVPYYYIEMIINLVLAFVFTYWNFSRVRRQGILKDISFHLNVCIWYAVLTCFDILWLAM